MTPCLRLYAHLGQALAGTRTSETYVDWIDTYADDDYQTINP